MSAAQRDAALSQNATYETRTREPRSFAPAALSCTVCPGVAVPSIDPHGITQVHRFPVRRKEAAC